MKKRMKGMNRHPCKANGMLAIFIAVISGLFVFGGGTVSNAADVIRYSCSAQIYDAFEQDRLNLFEKKSDISVDVHVCSSDAAVSRLENGLSDVASTVVRLNPRYAEKGYVETMFCKDPLVIMTHPVCAVDRLSEEQLRGIFSGKITNWKAMGGPDKPIIVIIPSEETGAYKNFSQMIMNGEEMVFDLKSHISTLVIETTRRFPYSISFITYGAVNWQKLGLVELKINGIAPRHNGYPYYQVYAFVSKGKPAGTVKAFIDFALDEGRDIIKRKGMMPY